MGSNYTLANLMSGYLVDLQLNYLNRSSKVHDPNIYVDIKNVLVFCCFVLRISVLFSGSTGRTLINDVTYGLNLL